MTITITALERSPDGGKGLEALSKYDELSRLRGRGRTLDPHQTCGASFNHLVSDSEHARRNGQAESLSCLEVAESLSCLEVNDKFELG